VPKKNKIEPSAAAPEVESTKGKSSKSRRKSTGGRAAKKTATKRAAAGQKGKSKRPNAGATKPNDEEIRIRAYFISERRRRLGLPGDASSDWLEAKKQLLSETGPR
jgi:hypothetical protein